MRWTIAQVADVLAARAGAGLDPVARLAGVSIDSRTVRPGELFVAIHGPRHDGHDHVAGALELGAIDFVAKPEQRYSFDGPIRKEILQKVRLIRSLRPLTSRPIPPRSSCASASHAGRRAQGR